LTKQKSGQRQAIDALLHFNFSPVALEPVPKPFCDESYQNYRNSDAPNTCDNKSQNLRNNDAYVLAVCDVLTLESQRTQRMKHFCDERNFHLTKNASANGKSSTINLLL
jgi:hypothetical protein